MKKILFVFAFILLLSPAAFSAEKTDGSIGETAGKAVAEMKDRLDESYKTAQEKSETAKKDLEVMRQQMQSALDDFNKQAAKTLADLNTQINSIRGTMEAEIKKFNDTLAAAEAEKKAASPAPSVQP
ncbi:MAG TPA: hypothetical protein VL688_12845 [Verrucomicrobiae bacterium]|jgi:DNA anti-recombination protein RmuC|nr:hypothetical protein [Verrucomicrobiae bacterium]